ncbi:uncharacterized protein LOC131007057 [Salvia miltiorrhiza]|uniref:uncharacterized protein LOC131007057 n=1 Tax=Salvia miltiorrhiza TaxID=226208 RepID=UPI0025ABDAF0|nr:uncharacterized protein LOC131007057 [Salvia miltiorrhiza]
MEVAIIDWKSIDSRVVIDDLYEHINAPKWADLTAQDDPVDDEAWFCRPDCNHPKKVEDFFNHKDSSPISNPKIQRSASVSDIPLYQRGNRDGTLKKRGTNQPNFVSDAENQDPNFSTPLQYKARVGKATIKSKQDSDAGERAPKLRSTLSARNLFSGTDLLSKVSEFCNELKKLTTRAQEKENHAEECASDREKERKPLLETGSSKGRLRRKKRNDDGENTPISVDVKSIKHLDAEGRLPIRNCPPTPQCFSATPKPFRPRPLERGILQELKQMEKGSSSSNGGGEVAEKEARSLDVFWFLKPYTLSS